MVANAIMGVHQSLVDFSRARIVAGERGPRLQRQVRAQGKRALETLGRGLQDMVLGMSAVYVPPARHLLRAKDLADARYVEPLDVDDLARAAGLSRAHFSREFRRAFGESPHAYLLTRRLERAAALLRTTDRSVADICSRGRAEQRRLVHDQLHADVRRLADAPTARRSRRPPPAPGPGVRRARLRAAATPHVSRRQADAGA